ncbi:MULTISPECIES: type IV pilus biogenesis/stability protein PilW [unclassified Halomonas]|nr:MULTISPECIES: type IV pilus biogenesis/stability protein PilW [unclassified Halomonas]QJQ94484.1 type IV pilus biogenesis/stability protein PilW [Halomonas sp. PA5]
MIRLHPLLERWTSRPFLAAVLSAAWLSGCAGQGPQTQSGANPADAYTQLGVAYLERDNLPRARGALNRALEIAPDDAETLQAMAMVHQRQGEQRLADDYFRRALESNPDSTRARNNYAAYLYEHGRLAEACSQLELATRDTQYDNRAQLFANLGQCQRDMGDTSAARASLERAQAIDARSPRSYFTLAQLEYSQGNYLRAWEQLQVFKRLAGTTTESQSLAEQIATARGE